MHMALKASSRAEVELQCDATCLFVHLCLCLVWFVTGARGRVTPLRVCSWLGAFTTSPHGPEFAAGPGFERNEPGLFSTLHSTSRSHSLLCSRSLTLLCLSVRARGWGSRGAVRRAVLPTLPSAGCRRPTPPLRRCCCRCCRRRCCRCRWWRCCCCCARSRRRCCCCCCCCCCPRRCLPLPPPGTAVGCAVIELPALPLLLAQAAGLAEAAVHVAVRGERVRCCPQW